MEKRFLTKGHAYIYLKTLLSKSKIFKDKVNVLRQELGIKRPFVNDPTIYPTKWEELGKKRKNFDLRGNKSFCDFCRYFFLPEGSWGAFAVYLYTDRKFQILDNAIHIMTSGGDQPQTLRRKFLVPYTAIYVPVGVSREVLASKWKQISENQELANKFLQGVHKWKTQDTFDETLCYYRIKKEKPKITDKDAGELVKEMMGYEERHTFDFRGLDDRRDHLQEQLAALEGWYLSYF